jgi:hypothetical protein
MAESESPVASLDLSQVVVKPEDTAGTPTGWGKKSPPPTL